MKLDDVVPWGRSLDEYRRMFRLSEQDLTLRILGCADGPASFNAEMQALGHRVVSFDPLYAFSKQDIERRVGDAYTTIIAQLRRDQARYVWEYFPNPEALGRARLRAMDMFLRDFEAGLREGRYQVECLPRLGLADQQFGISLCSHLLFLYSKQLALDFHLASISELLRVSAELRVFPLLDLDCARSPHLEPVCAHFSAQGFAVDILDVPYEFQQGGNQMLRISRHS